MILQQTIINIKKKSLSIPLEFQPDVFSDSAPIITNESQLSAEICNEVNKIIKLSKNETDFLELIRLKLTQFQNSNFIKNFATSQFGNMINDKPLIALTILITSNSDDTAFLLFENIKFSFEKMHVNAFMGKFHRPGFMECPVLGWEEII